jgi:hypothetical protein
MSSCRHRSSNDGGATSGEETLDKTHNNQSLNTNGAAAINYKGSRDMRTPLDTPLLGSDMIHGSKKYGVATLGQVLETRLVS